MNTKLFLSTPKKYLLIFSSFLLLSTTIPYIVGSGLDNPESFGSYLNGKGSLFIDDVQLAVKKNGIWKEIEVPHNGFEADLADITDKKIWMAPKR